jgi:hypothetical protein
MSFTPNYGRHAAGSGNLIPGTAGRDPVGSTVIAFQPIQAPSHLRKNRRSVSSGPSAQIIPLDSRRVKRLTEPAWRGWPDERTNGQDFGTRDDDSQRMRQNILAIGWVGTLMAVAYCMLMIPMH